MSIEIVQKHLTYRRCDDEFYLLGDDLAVLKGELLAYEAAKATATGQPVMVDLEAGAKALWQGSTPWEDCTQQHRDYWRGQAKACAEAWGFKYVDR